MKTHKVHVISRDSLGEKIAEYDTQLDDIDYRKLMSEADCIDGQMIAVKDVQIDDELGSREFYLT